MERHSAETSTARGRCGVDTGWGGVDTGWGGVGIGKSRTTGMEGTPLKLEWILGVAGYRNVVDDRQ